MKNDNHSDTKNLIILCIFAVFLVGASGSFADSTQQFGDVKLYKQAPSAYEIAKTLFPPRTRTIILDQEASAPPPPPSSVAFMIKFEYDSVSIEDVSRPYLDALGDMLNFAQLKGKTLQIEGHADAAGDAQYNLRLSESRALSIKRYLQSVHNIEPNRLYTMGYGESKLLDKARPYSEVNRRAEFSPLETSVN